VIQSIILVLAGLTFSTNPGANPHPWVKVNEDQGLVIWNRDIPGSKIRELKAVVVVDFPVEKIWAVIDDIEKYTEFMPYLEEVQVLEKEPNKVVAYHRLDAPLVSERDYTLLIESTPEPEKRHYFRSWKIAEGAGPQIKDGIVRVRVCDGSWTLKSVGPNKTHLTYFLHTHPGGSVPMWIANKANTVSLPALFEAITNRTRNSRWTR